MRRRLPLILLLLAALALASADVSFGDAVISVSPASPFNFGNHKVNAGPADSQQFTVSNTGDADLHITTVDVTGSGFSPGQDPGPNTCSPGTTVTAGNSCTVTVLFLPTAAGATQGALTVNDSDGVAPFPVELDGTGTLPAAEVPNAVSFSTPANVPVTMPVTLTNIGPAQMDVDHATLTGDAEFTNTGNGNCGNAVLNTGQSCSAQIQFLPTSVGTYNATVSFSDDAPDSPQSVPLTGTVKVPGINASPTSLSFGDLTAGHLSPSKQVTISNTGQADLHIGSVKIGGLNAPAFKLISQSCTDGAITPSSSCTANVAFRPMIAASRVGALTFVNDAGPDQVVSLTGQGVPPPDPTGVSGASGCRDVKLDWRPPDGAEFFKEVVVVRKSKSYPQGPGDGTTVTHSGSSVIDTGLRQFHTYRYTIFAKYGSYNGRHRIYSAGVHVRAHTGRICSPRDNGSTADLTPKVDWTGYTGTRSYAFILQRSGRTIWVHYVKRSYFHIPSSWTYKGQRHSLAHGSAYTFYLYAYTRRHPNGIAIGHTSWLER